MKNLDINIGCCGFRWSQEKYYEKFSLVEVQHTFYQPPTIPTLIKWRNAAPKNFEFTLKAWQRITHLGNSPTYKRIKTPLTEEEAENCGNFQNTETVHEAMKVTLECAEALKTNKILFQCPAKFIPSDINVENMRTFFSRPRPKNFTYLWEPRGKWPEALISQLCNELSLTHVVNPFVQASVTQGLYYYRIHGRTGKQTYTDSDLKELLKCITPDEKTYILFNNIYMLKDAERFKQLVF